MDINNNPRTLKMQVNNFKVVVSKTFYPMSKDMVMTLYDTYNRNIGDFHNIKF